MIVTEDRNTTINFSNKSCSIEYYEDAKVIYIRFKSAEEIDKDSSVIPQSRRAFGITESLSLVSGTLLFPPIL